MINMFTVLTVNTQQSENVGREPRRCMPQLNLDLHVDHVAILRLCTAGVIDTWLVSVNIPKYTVITLRAHIHWTITQLDTLLSIIYS